MDRNALGPVINNACRTGLDGATDALAPLPAQPAVRPELSASRRSTIRLRDGLPKTPDGDRLHDSAGEDFVDGA